MIIKTVYDESDGTYMSTTRDHPDIVGYGMCGQDAESDLLSRIAAITVTSETTWQDRLRQELSELQGRIGKLNAFLNSDQFDNLDDVDKRLLIDQRGFMLNYHGILRLRVARIGK